MLTTNTDKLRREVAAHVAADRVAQGIYWDEEAQRGCFIGCLNHSNNPSGAEKEYGLPIAVQRIAESIFEALPASEATAFFAALPDVMCDGKNLSLVHWQFLASELRNLPPVDAETQAVVGPVISGIERLAKGQQWPTEAAEAAWAAAGAAWAARAAEAGEAAEAAAWAARAAAGAAEAAEAAAGAAAWAARAAAGAARAAAGAAWAARAAEAAVVRRQRDLLLQLIRDAEVQS